MTHYRALFDNEFVGAWDLGGKDVVVTIDKVERGLIKSREKPSGDQKPIVTLRGKKLPFACNKTNAKTIAGMYGPDTADWVGKNVTFYATTTQAKGGEMVECIRIRPMIPKARAAKGAPADAPSDAQPSACPECGPNIPPDEGCGMCFGSGKVSP